MSSSFPGPLTEKEEQYYVQQLEQNDPDRAKSASGCTHCQKIYQSRNLSG